MTLERLFIDGKNDENGPFCTFFSVKKVPVCGLEKDNMLCNSWLRKVLKTRVFPAKYFLVRNSSILAAVFQQKVDARFSTQSGHFSVKQFQLSLLIISLLRKALRVEVLHMFCLCLYPFVAIGRAHFRHLFRFCLMPL